MVQWLRLHVSSAGGTDLIPGQGSKTPPHATEQKERKKVNEYELCKSAQQFLFYHLTHLHSSQQGGERRIVDSLTRVRGYRVKWLESRRVTLHIHHALRHQGPMTGWGWGEG